MARTYIISYDMAEKGNYNDLYKAIKSYGTWAKITESTWAIVTESKAEEIRDHLEQYFPSGSSLFVIKSGTVAAWMNVQCSNEWLKKHL